MYWRREIGQLIQELLGQIPAYKPGETIPSSDLKVQLKNLWNLLLNKNSTKKESLFSFSQVESASNETEIRETIKNVQKFIKEKEVYQKHQLARSEMRDDQPDEFIDRMFLENEAHLDDQYNERQNKTGQ